MDNLRVVGGHWDSAVVAWRLVCENPDVHEVGVFVDGELAAVVPAVAGDQRAGLANLAAGTHEVEVWLLELGGRLPDTRGNLTGSRVRFDWVAAPETDVAGYAVTLDGAAAAVVVDEIVVQGFRHERPHSGTGQGRASVYGAVPAGTAVNVAGTVEVLAGGRLSTPAGEVGIVTGQSVSLPHGAWLVLHDDPEDYAEGDTWTYRVGPRSNWVSGELAVGLHTVRVAAVDAAGNVGTATANRTVRIVAIPDPVSGVSATFDATGRIVLLEWDQVPDLVSVAVYANWVAVPGELREAVYLREPLAVVDWESSEVTIEVPSPHVGRLRVYLRPRLGGLELEDLTLHEWGIPAEPADLGVVVSAPAGLTATATAGGTVRVAWHHRPRDTEATTNFAVWVWPEGETVDWDDLPVGTVAVSASVGWAGWLAEYAVTVNPAVSSGTLVRVGVRSRDVAGRTDGNTMVAMATVDADAPAAVAASWAGAQ